MSNGIISAWRPTPVRPPLTYRSLLADRGSLTRRLQEMSREFRVEKVMQRLAQPARDERQQLGLRRGELALVREVVLYCDDLPVVFAHSVAARKNLRGAWRGLKQQGNKPLGAALFANPRIARTALKFRKLNAQHELYRRAKSRLPDIGLTQNLWARRSRFTLRGQPLLVTEIFLPGIAGLAKT